MAVNAGLALVRQRIRQFQEGQDAALKELASHEESARNDRDLLLNDLLKRIEKCEQKYEKAKQELETEKKDRLRLEEEVRRLRAANPGPKVTATQATSISNSAATQPVADFSGKVMYSES